MTFHPIRYILYSGTGFLFTEIHWPARGSTEISRLDISFTEKFGKAIKIEKYGYFIVKLMSHSLSFSKTSLASPIFGWVVVIAVQMVGDYISHTIKN